MTQENSNTITPKICVQSLKQVFFSRIIPAILAGILIGWGLTIALRAVDGARWPSEWDAHRDASIAQSILDGRYPEDPILSGEVSWFNPMTGAVIALVSRITGLTPPAAVVKMGPWLNLIAPIGFYLLMAAIFDGRTALAALCLFLFGKDPSVLSCIRATYMPWLMAPWYAPGLFCFTLLMFHVARTRNRTDYYALAGVLLGVTFICHTAPAVFSGAVMTFVVLSDAYAAWRTPEGLRSAQALIQRFLLLLLIAFLMSLPYTGPILWRYQFQVQNVWPTLFATVYVELGALPARLWEIINWRNLIVALGILTLLRQRREERSILILGLFFIALVFLIQNYVWQVLVRKGVVFPAIVPGHHAVIYLTLAQSALWGVGAVAFGQFCIRLIPQVLKHFGKRLPGQMFGSQEVIIWIAVVSLCLPLYALGGWHFRTEFKPIYPKGYVELYERQIPVYDWIMSHTTPSTTFLCPEEGVGIGVVMPAGRKLVSTMIFYYNPYVSMARSSEAQRVFMEAVEACDRNAFYEQAKTYPDLYVLIRDAANETHRKHLDLMLHPVLRAGGYSLYRVLPEHPPENSAETTQG